MKIKSEPATSREATCEECGAVGNAGTQIVPYSFENKGERRWLCWSGSGRECLKLAWQKFKEKVA